MDVALQRHCARFIYVVPEGLRELMSDITREVLRNQPEDLYTFVADYMDALLIIRENARVAAKFVQEMTECAETIVDLLTRTGMDREEADRVATVIQRHFRAYLDRKGILKESEEKFIEDILDEAAIPPKEAVLAAIVIQNAFRQFKARKEKRRLLLSGIIDWRVAARSAIKLYRRTGVSVEEAKRAADLIKAAYRGYYTRKTLQRLKEEGARWEEEEAMAEQSEDELVVGEDTSSTDSETAKKSKAVRIDYSSVIPHVDFQEPDVISEPSQDLASPSSVEFIKNLLLTDILSSIGEEREPEEVEALHDMETMEETEEEGAGEPQSVAEEVPAEKPQVEEHDADVPPEGGEELIALPEAAEEIVPEAEESPVGDEGAVPPSEDVPAAAEEVAQEADEIVQEADEIVQEAEERQEGTDVPKDEVQAEPEAVEQEEQKLEPIEETTTEYTESTAAEDMTPGETTEGYTTESEGEN